MKRIIALMLAVFLLTGCSVSTAITTEDKVLMFTEYGIDSQTAGWLAKTVADEYMPFFQKHYLDNDEGCGLESLIMYSEKTVPVEQLEKILQLHGPEGFSFCSYFLPYEGKTFKLLATDECMMSNIARYLWYMEKHGVDEETAIHDVNLDMDIPAEPGDYTDLVDDPNTVCEEIVELLLINRHRRVNELRSWYTWFERDMVFPGEKYADEGVLLENSIAMEFKTMADDLYAQTGKQIKVANGFISEQQQAELYDNAVKEHGEEYADKYVPKPGHSEHQSVTGIDIYEVGTALEDFGETASFRWLVENAHKYYFGLRYLKGKEFITGYPYCPYHFHFYNGLADEAHFLQVMNMTYEEYWYMTRGFDN